MTSPSMPPKPEVVTRTFFFQGSNKDWYWSTKALNNEIIADGSEGYKTLKDAMKGFFLTHGVVKEDFGSWPNNFGPLLKLPENKFQINKFLAESN